MNINTVLEKVGLSDGEQKVYLALLELGESTSGPIAQKSGVSASKVYQVLERLMTKGLVGEARKRGRKYFSPLHPKAIIDYLEEEQRQLQKTESAARSILPQLVARYEEQAKETEVQLSKGMKSLHQTFYNLLEELKPGEEYLVIGGSKGRFSESAFKRFFTHFHTARAERNIKAKLLFQASVPTLEATQKKSEIRYLPPNFQNPMQINIHNETTDLILLQQEPIIFTIKNKEIAASFTQYFEQLWNQRVQTWTGEEAIPRVADELLASGEELYLIGERGEIVQRYPEIYKRIVREMELKGLKRYQLVRETTRKSEFTTRGLVETHFLPAKMLGPLVIWIYGDIVNHIIWEEEITVLHLQNKKFADDYRTYFDFLRQISLKAKRGRKSVTKRNRSQPLKSVCCSVPS